MSLLDFIMLWAAFLQAFNMWRVSKLETPAITFFVSFALFTVAEVWMALEGQVGMWAWAGISIWGLWMSTVAIHKKYFRERFDEQ